MRGSIIFVMRAVNNKAIPFALQTTNFFLHSFTLRCRPKTIHNLSMVAHQKCSQIWTLNTTYIFSQQIHFSCNHISASDDVERSRRRRRRRQNWLDNAIQFDRMFIQSKGYPLRQHVNKPNCKKKEQVEITEIAKPLYDRQSEKAISIHSSYVFGIR